MVHLHNVHTYASVYYHKIRENSRKIVYCWLKPLLHCNEIFDNTIIQHSLS